MRSPCLWSLLLLTLTAVAVGCGGGLGGSAGANTPPVLVASSPSGIEFAAGQQLTFSVTVSDPDGDAVSLRLRNPAPGMWASPISSAPSPQTLTVHWTVPAGALTGPTLHFAAHDDGTPSATVDLLLPTRCTGQSRNGMLRGDVTGDGIPDLVALASGADAPFLDSGAIYVWRGESVMGTTQPANAPIKLTRPGGLGGDQLGLASGQALFLVHVTGAGPALDIVAVAQYATVSGQAQAGALCVWKGGVGNSAPTFHATLALPLPVGGDQLGVGAGQAVQFGDVCGDAALDLVVSAYNAEQPTPPVANAGVICVWAGGAALPAGAPAPIQLRNPTTITNEYLGRASGQGVQLVDLMGDAKLEIVAAAPSADVSAPDAGAIYVWQGAAALASGPPTTTLRNPLGQANDFLGSELAPGQGVRFGDVVGDQRLDVIVCAPSATVSGSVQAGALYVWDGAALVPGQVSPTLTLTSTNPSLGARLGRMPFSGEGLFLVDLTGEGDLDIVACAPREMVGSTPDAGAIYVWKGKTGLSAPLARLTTPTPFAQDQLGAVGPGEGEGLSFGDVDGDGITDLVVSAPSADRSLGTQNTGALYVWRGGPALTGSVPPTSQLLVGLPSANDRLGSASGQGVLLGDVTGDGRLDVVAAAMDAQVGSNTTAGAIYVWPGPIAPSPFLTPAAILTSATPTTNDKLGYVASGLGLRLGDLNGDGVDDVIAVAEGATVSGNASAGAVVVWFGSGSLPPTPSLTLTAPSPQPFDKLGLADGLGVQLVDVTADGFADLVVGAKDARVGLTVGAGSIFVWKGGPTVSATLTAQLAVVGAATNDHLGSGTGQAIQVGDVTGDGIPDILALASGADAPLLDSGAIYVWKLAQPSTLLPGPMAPTFTLTDATAAPGDGLGS